MFIIRITLLLICSLSLGWSALVFGGPLIIKRLIIIYTDGAVTPSSISVSPKLEVNIGRLDYNIESNFFRTPIEGYSRSNEISWSFLN